MSAAVVVEFEPLPLLPGQCPTIDHEIAEAHSAENRAQAVLTKAWVEKDADRVRIAQTELAAWGQRRRALENEKQMRKDHPWKDRKGTGLSRSIADILDGKPQVPDGEVERPARSPNRVLSAAEFVGELKPREFLIEDLILADAGIIAIVGASKAGKSFFLIDMANAIQTGRQWRGLDVKRGRVVYICAEGGGDFRYRLAAYGREFDVALADQIKVIDNAPNLLKAEAAADVIAQIKAAGGADFVVCDTLNATMVGGKENDSEHTSIYLANLKAIRKATGAQVAYVHHFGKDEGKGQRGHSSLPAAVDTEISITREGENRTATVTKAKGGPEGAQFPFALKAVQLGIDHKGKPYGSCVVEPAESARSRGATRKRPKKGTPLLVLQTMESVFKTDAPTMGELFDVMQEQLEASASSPGRAKEYFRVAVEKLADTEVDQWLFRHPGERISLNPVLEASSVDF
jgi:hypothetical protein